MDPDDNESSLDSFVVRDNFLEFMQDLLKDYDQFLKDVFYNADGTLQD